MSARPRGPRRRWPVAASEHGRAGCGGVAGGRDLRARSPGADAGAPMSPKVDARRGRRRRARSSIWRAPGSLRAGACRARRRRRAARAGRRRPARETSAASRSLSPKRISWVATVSFSLTIGRMRRSSRRSIARWALLRCVGFSRSPAVSSTWPATIRSGRGSPGSGRSARSGRPRPRPAAWRGRWGGRRARRYGMPVAIAPDETRMTSVPRRVRGGERVDERLDLAGVRAADRRRTDLDDDAARRRRHRRARRSRSRSSSSGRPRSPRRRSRVPAARSASSSARAAALASMRSR